MRPCLKLRQKCLEMDYTSGQLAKAIGRSPSYVSEIFGGKAVADAADIYGMATALQIPPEEWEVYFFPPEVRKKLEQKIRERKGKA